MEQLMTVPEVAEALHTSERFVRRLVAERRIAFTHIGRHVRVAESVVQAFIAAGRVEPLEVRWRDGGVVA